MKIDYLATAEVPLERRAVGIRWLVIQFDVTSGGWFLFGHKTLEEPSEFDSWHETQGEAFLEAKRQWGVEQTAWEARQA